MLITREKANPVLIRPSDESHAKPATEWGRDTRLIREAVIEWGRFRWPGARVMHEIVVGRGDARIDVLFVTPDHMAAVEIKSPRDSTTRLLHQAGMFRLCCPELWLAVAPRHVRDAEMIRYILPSIGIIEAHQDGLDAMRVEIKHDSLRFVPHRMAMLQVPWVMELAEEAKRANVWHGSYKYPPRHSKLVELMHLLSDAECLAAVCRRLRARTTNIALDDLPISETPQHGNANRTSQ